MSKHRRVHLDQKRQCICLALVSWRRARQCDGQRLPRSRAGGRPVGTSAGLHLGRYSRPLPGRGSCLCATPDPRRHRDGIARNPGGVPRLRDRFRVIAGTSGRKQSASIPQACFRDAGKNVGACLDGEHGKEGWGGTALENKANNDRAPTWDDPRQAEFSTVRKSSSKYSNHAGLRNWVTTEFLRRPDPHFGSCSPVLELYEVRRELSDIEAMNAAFVSVSQSLDIMGGIETHRRIRHVGARTVLTAGCFCPPPHMPKTALRKPTGRSPLVVSQLGWRFT